MAMINRTLLTLRAAALALIALPASAAAQVAVDLEVDLLEVHLGRGDDHLLFDSTLTLGDAADQFLVKGADGSETRTAFDDFEVQALYSRQVSDATALHLGIRHDLRAGPDLTHAVAGLAVEVLPGLEAEHYVFLSQDGDITGAGQILLAVDLAPRLMVEPRLRFGWSAQRNGEEALGHGLTDIEASVRLRRSLGQYFNVYTGVIHERLVGSTRTIAVAAGDPSRVTRAVVGVGIGF